MVHAHVNNNGPPATAEVSQNIGMSSKIINWINGYDSILSSSSHSSSSSSLSIIEISTMRVRDIKRRLSRQHGYTADEIAAMLDKKELINALAFEEHKSQQKEKEKRKRVALRRSIIVALICVIVVTFKGLFVHAFEVASVNFVVYTDKKKYEWGRCRELKSVKALFGLFATVFVNTLQLWLSASVILSWVMKSKYFFPVPYIPIKPAALLATAAGTTSRGGGGPFDNYGLNVGPMFISGLFRFLNGRIEAFMGRALAEGVKRQRMERKAAKREEERVQEELLRQERKAARRARRAERELRKQQQQQQQAAEAASGVSVSTSEVDDNGNRGEEEESQNNGGIRQDGTNKKDETKDGIQLNGMNTGTHSDSPAINEPFIGGMNDLD